MPIAMPPIAPTPSRKATRHQVWAALCTAALCACAPYPDDGEFFAGVVFARNFVAGVRTLSVAAQPPASNPTPPRGQNDARPNAYSLLLATGTSAQPTVSSTTPATSPLWQNLYGTKVTRPDGTQVPLHTDTAQQVYVFDGPCQAPDNYAFDERYDLFRGDRQYPIFQDLPEVLATNGGRPGRLTPANYSAIVEVVHVQLPSGFPCQSVKRWKTVTDRTAAKTPGDLALAAAPTTKEYRLLLIVDPVLTTPPLPVQLGWFDQLLVPYIDMGPVPVDPDKSAFLTMPVVRFTSPTGTALNLPRAVLATPDERDRITASPYRYSPLCRTVDVPIMTAVPASYDLAAYKAQIDAAPQNPRANLTPCLICNSTSDGQYNCPLAQSGAGAR